MMVALTQVVWSSAREAGQLRRATSSRFPITQLAQQMRIDFANARGMVVDSQGVTLHGFLGADPSTQRPLLTPSRVRYEIAKIGQDNVLIRSTATWREPVWLGIQSLRIEPLEQLDRESGNLPAPESGGLPAVPSRFRISMIGDDGQPLWREVIHHGED
jgi:hypothetical protein